MEELNMPTLGSGSDFLGAIANIGSNLLGYTLQKKAAKQAAKSNRQAGSLFGLNYGPASSGQMTPYDPWGVSGSLLGSGLGALGYGPDAPGAASCANMFVVQAQGAPRSRAVSLVSAMSPSGELHWWRHVGKPILFSGDVSHCRRVNKLLGKASRRAGRRGGR